ncbi:MAG: GNAT family N-acetyltransferase [Dermatophilaceae bacterium]
MCLEPLRAAMAAELAPVLADPLLHTFIGGEPLDRKQLEALYQRQVVGRSADGSQRWLNWLVRDHRNGQAMGTVQATVGMQRDGLTAEVAWVIGTTYQGQGYAKEAAGLLVDWLREQGVNNVVAHVHPQHKASMAVARAAGLAPTRTLVDREVRWQG